MELRSIYGLLQVHAEIDVAEERVERPLLLLVAARRAPREARLPVSKRETRAERRSRARSRAKRGGEPLFQPEHLRARPERPPERRNDRRALQPAAAGRRRDEVAEPIRDVEMHGATARLARAGCRDGIPEAREVPEARPVFAGGFVADERAALVVVGRREQRLDGNLGVAVQRIPIRERELRAFGDDVDELGL